MAMVVKNNLGATRTLNTLNKNEKARDKSLARTSSGMKINSAQDDASGYAISERMRVRIRALDQANQNTQNDAALMRTAGGAVDNTVEILRALKEKAINAANDANTDEDRYILQKEAHQLIDQINDNALAQFNGKYLIDGTRNYAPQSTRTVLLNQSLATNTLVNAGPTYAITKYKNRAGDSLEIQSSDRYEVSWVINGVTSTVSGQVGDKSFIDIVPHANNTQVAPVNATQANKGKIDVIQNKFGQQIYTPDNTAGIAVTSHSSFPGTEHQVDGFTISITDDKGNVKKTANAALNDFHLYQRAENKTDGDGSLTFQVGSEANVAIKVALTDMRAHALGLEGKDGNKLLFVPKENANAAINVFNNAIEMALDQSTSIGAVLSRLDYTSANLTTASENVQASESTIRDADMAKEMTEYTKNNVLMQAAQAMLAQANQSSSAVISLLQ
ncbi:MAG: flagellin [Quinella sp. 1Q7]|nr:flagellin [Quinella sp. 1Q7]